jgi:hypothetical protein
MHSTKDDAIVGETLSLLLSAHDETRRIAHSIHVHCWRPESPQKLGYAAVRGQRSVFFSKRRKNSTSTELTSPLKPVTEDSMPRATLGEMVAMAIVGCLRFRGLHRHSTYMTATCMSVLLCCVCVPLCFVCMLRPPRRGSAARNSLPREQAVGDWK